MKTLRVRYAGVDLTEYPDHLKRNLPDGRFNYFEVPWNASCPGYGHVLVTASQLTKIREAVNETTGSDLELQVYDGENKLVEDESVTLHNIIPIRAIPLWGEFFRNKDVERGGQPSPGQLEDTPDNSEGLWSLEIQDLRTYYNNLTWIPLDKGAFNLQDTPFNGTRFVKSTAKSETQAWTTKEVLEKVIDPNYLVDSVQLTSLPRVYDIYVAGLPALVAADLILNATLTDKVFRYDPSSEENQFRIHTVALNEDVSGLLQAHYSSRIFGGSQTVFRAFQFPKALPVWRDRASVRSDLSDYYDTSPGTPSDVIPYVRHTRTSVTNPTSFSYRTRTPYRAIYKGFRKAFLDATKPISLVVFDWSNLPTTEVHIGHQSPIRTLLDSSVGHFYRDIPLRVPINGDIGAPERPDLFKWFVVKAVGDDHLICREWLGIGGEGSVDINVAKPYELRRSSYAGKTITFNGVTLSFTYINGYTRDVGFPGGTERQIIIPAYTGTGINYVGERILAVRTETHLEVQTQIVHWQDLNIGGRYFGVEEQS